MSQYTVGSVSVTNGSQIVTGAGTLWLANVTAGDLFTIQDSGVTYQVGAVNSDTELALSANYAGVTDTNLGYVVARDFTPTHNIPLINRGDIETATIFSRAMQIIDGLL